MNAFRTLAGRGLVLLLVLALLSVGCGRQGHPLRSRPRAPEPPPVEATLEAPAAEIEPGDEDEAAQETQP